MRRFLLPSLSTPARSVSRWTLLLAVGLFLAACTSIPPQPQPAKPAPVPVPPPAVQVAPLPPVPPPAVPPPSLSGAPSGTTLVGLMLPLSGPSANIGTAMFNAAQLALFEVGDDTVTLLPLDSKGTEEGAAAAAQQGRDQHVELVVGPLFAAEAKGTAGVLRPAHIPVLALTTDQALAGDGVYVLGMQPGNQVLRVVSYAHDQNLQRLAVLAPNNEYGRLVSEAVSNGADARGVMVTAREYYDPLASDFSSSIKRLLAHRRDDDPGFDGLIIPDEGQRLRMVVTALVAQGLDPARTRLLGTMLWDEATGDTALAGGWYALPSPASFADFETHYAKAFGAKPPRLASLAYDATALAVVLARHHSHDFSARLLTNPQGFAGANGLFRLLPDGTAERGYSVMEIEPGAPSQEISPAPAAF